MESVRCVGYPIVLVIDDLELLGPEASELLNQVIAHLPDNVRTVLIGRSMPAALRTARRLLDGSAQELGAAELAFTVEEAESLFERTNAGINPSQASALVDLTMGWPVGLRLAATTTQEGSLSTHFWDALGGDRHVLRRYIDEELLGGLEADDRSFLLESSVLEWLDGDLCDRVLDLRRSADRLERLVADGRVLFVTGGSRRNLRYHPVLRDLLIDQLRTVDPTREAEIRLNAIAAYEAMGEHRTAIDTAIASGNARVAEEVLFRHLATVMLSGEYVSLGRWLSHFSAQQKRGSGLLALAEALLALVTNRRTDLDAWLAIADHAGHDGPMPDGSVSFEVASSAVRMLAGAGGVTATIDHARRVRDAGPLGSPWWEASGGIDAIATHLAGLAPDAAEVLRSAEFEARGVHSSHAAASANLGFAELQKGNTLAGLALVRGAVDEVTEASLVDFPLMAMVFCVKSYADAVRGDAARSSEAAAHARILMSGVSDIIDRAFIHARLVLSEAALERVDHDQARLELRHATERLPTEPDAVVLHVWAERLRERIDRSSTRMPSAEITGAERRVLEQLPTHRSLAEIGAHLYVSRNTVKSHSVSIYRKLGVGSRSDAVRRAMELGLL